MKYPSLGQSTDARDPSVKATLATLGGCAGLDPALRCFGVSAAQEKGVTEEKGTSWALVGLLELEQGREDPSRIALSAALDSMDLERRPWLTVRACLALALVLASRDAPDPALAALQEVWRLLPEVTDSHQGRADILSAVWGLRREATA